MGTAARASPSIAGHSRGLLLWRGGADERLARAAGDGDADAFAAIYERYNRPLYAYCRSIVRHDDDALDALQTTFTAAWSALRRGGRAAPLRPWLYRIAHNESISVLRRRARQPAADLEHAGCSLVAPSAAEDAARRDRWDLLVADLARLPGQARSALVLREMSGLSHEEIALALGTTVGAAKQSILEARRALGEMAEGREMQCQSIQERLSTSDGRMLRGRRVAAHLRSCAVCSEFAAAVKDRKHVFGAYTPALPAGAAATVLARIVGAGSHAGGSIASGELTALRTGLTAKAAGAATAWKAGALAIVAAGASAGFVAIHHEITQPQPHKARASHARPVSVPSRAGPVPSQAGPLPSQAGPLPSASPAGPVASASPARKRISPSRAHRARVRHRAATTPLPASAGHRSASPRRRRRAAATTTPALATPAMSPPAATIPAAVPAGAGAGAEHPSTAVHSHAVAAHQPAAARTRTTRPRHLRSSRAHARVLPSGHPQTGTARAIPRTHPRVGGGSGGRRDASAPGETTTTPVASPHGGGTVTGRGNAGGSPAAGKGPSTRSAR